MSNAVTARQNMVDSQVRTADVTDLRVIDAMRSVPREAFLPASQKALAYLDIDLTIDGTKDGRMIKPVVLARMLQAAEIEAGDKVLVAGTASGYAAAIAAHLAANVVAVVSDEGLAASTKAGLTAAGITDVTVTAGAAAAGDAAHGPYDVIVLDGATEIAPEQLYQQLKNGGRLVGVFALTSPSRATIVTRSPGDFGSRTLFDAAAPVVPGLKRVPAFAF
jgi:protein-L-isoaspartate(D-aspartate) O-methyltransferase